MHPPPSPARANFTLMTECTPESRRYYSVYSVEESLKGKTMQLIVAEINLFLSNLSLMHLCWRHLSYPSPNI